MAELTGTVLILDDDLKIVRDQHSALKLAFSQVNVVWSLAPDRRPRTDPPPQKSSRDNRDFEAPNPAWSEPMTGSDLLGCDVIVLDLQMKFADKSKTDPDELLAGRYGDFTGFFILDMAEKHGCLSRVFVNSAVFELLKIRMPTLADRLETLVATEQVGVYKKEGDGPQFLLARIHSVLDLKRRGYLLSPQTRNKLFLIGSAEAKSMEPVVILGKTGTGKESAAWHIHEIAQRIRNQQKLPLQVVHCGGLTAELARDELFGHAKGAFTDAKGFKMGSVLTSLGMNAGSPRSDDMGSWLLDGNPVSLERIDGGANLRVTTEAPFGTLFLDEFGELPPSVQALLLRFLNDGETQPLGYEGTISVKDKENRLHVRLIGATNRNMVLAAKNRDASAQAQTTEVRALSSGDSRAFGHSSVRDDLVFRLARWIIELPDMVPEEVDDLIRLEQQRRPDLADVIWESNAIEGLKKQVHDGAFPGQRRELRTVAMRAMAYAKGLSALGMNVYGNDSPVVNESTLLDAIRPVRIETDSEHKFSRLHSAICNLLRQEGVWAKCREGFQWSDLKGFDRIEICKMFLRSLLFVGKDGHDYSLDDLEIAWGVDPARTKNSTVRKSLEDYVTKALKSELGLEFSEEQFPPGMRYKDIRRSLRKLRGTIEI
jgi:hypothetical protein